MKYIPTRRSFFNDMFEDMFDDRTFEMPTLSNMMKTDVTEKDGNYKLEVELPGYAKEDIKVSLHKGNLEISATVSKTENENDEKGKLVHEERYFGSCKRTFYVGENVTNENVKASYDNGILTVEIMMPKEEPKSSYIEIN